MTRVVVKKVDNFNPIVRTMMKLISLNLALV